MNPGVALPKNFNSEMATDNNKLMTNVTNTSDARRAIESQNP